MSFPEHRTSIISRRILPFFDFELNNKKMEQMCSLNKEKRFFNATQEEVEKMVWNTEH